MIQGSFSKQSVETNTPFQLSEVYRNDSVDDFSALRANYSLLNLAFNTTSNTLAWIFGFAFFLLALEGKWGYSAVLLICASTLLIIYRSFKKKSDQMERSDAQAMTAQFSSVRKERPALFRDPDGKGYVTSSGEFVELDKKVVAPNQTKLLLQDGAHFYSVEIKVSGLEIITTQTIINKDVAIIELRSKVDVAQSIID